MLFQVSPSHWVESSRVTGVHVTRSHSDISKRVVMVRMIDEPPIEINSSGIETAVAVAAKIADSLNLSTMQSHDPEWSQEPPKEPGMYWIYRPGHLCPGPFTVTVSAYTYLGGSLGTMIGPSFPMELTSKTLSGSWWKGPIETPKAPETSTANPDQK